MRKLRIKHQQLEKDLKEVSANNKISRCFHFIKIILNDLIHSDYRYTQFQDFIMSNEGLQLIQIIHQEKRMSNLEKV